MLISILFTIAVIMIIFLLFWRLWFLRDPIRKIPEGDNVVSPADGKVFAITKLDSELVTMKKGLFGKIKTMANDVKGADYMISIFMSLMDVHVQRAPINGRIAKVKHSKGKFLAANSLDAMENEKNEILIEDLDSVKVIQIAGFLARRIECFVKGGEHVIKGQRIGRINLGSQVSIILPKSVKLSIKVGQRVRAGETILASFS